MSFTKYTNYPTRYALIDCDHFFVSCERLFNAALYYKPVVVLSSNDACIIARSPEAKALGIGMSDSLYETQALIKKHNVIALSSNFTLYADISARVMATIMHAAPDCEIYSIDEAFIKLSLPYGASPSYFTDFCLFLKKTIYQQIGIPVTIGIGPTKTLAKISHAIAKKEKLGVFDISDTVHDHYLAHIPVTEIWGVGRRYGKKLKSYGIFTVFDFKRKDPQWIRKLMTIQGLRTHEEIHGLPRIALATVQEEKKSIIFSRLFGRAITTREELEQAVSYYCAQIARKLREQNSCTLDLSLFLIVQRSQDPERFSLATHLTFPRATSYIPELTQGATQSIMRLYKPGLLYRKAGLMCHTLVADTQIQSTLEYQSFIPDPRHEKIMQTIDDAEDRWGRDTLFFASEGTDRPWRMRQQRRTPHYTTNWNDLLSVS